MLPKWGKHIVAALVFFVMSWCTSTVWLLDLPFIDNRHLVSITRLQQIPCVYLLQFQVNCTWYPLQTLYTCVHSNEAVPD